MYPMNSMDASYDLLIVAASLLIATVASYVALDLARRVRTHQRSVARNWWFGGSIVLGTGIWAMHFVGMLAFSLPIALGYTKGLTLLSWVAAVVVSGVALSIASRGALTMGRLAFGSLAMGGGICTMHYTGMAALDMAPGIVWNGWLVAASALIAVTASAAALLMFFWLRGLGDARGPRYQVLAAGVMGLAISGMHYTGMAAASFPEGAVCLSADSLSGEGVGVLVSLATISLLVVTWLTSFLDTRMRTGEARFAESLKLANAQLQSANEALQKQAFLDPLTHLPNRLLFEDRLRHAVARAERREGRLAGREPERLAVFFIDLDGFKSVNDSLGHASGDDVLMEAARRLNQAARESDTVARVGGDEFLLLMEGVGGLPDCVQLARRLLASLALPFDTAGRQVEISGSVGVVLYPDHGQPDKLVAHADTAMYAAKRAGGNTYAMFEAHMNDGGVDLLSLQSELRQAIGTGQLTLHYQPKVDGRKGHIRGVEALVRWNHPQRGLLGPGEFIPVAERFGLINALGDWVIQETCRQLREWSRAGAHMRVAINLSVHQLREGSLVTRIQTALQDHGVDPSQLLCEITESVAMEDIVATQRSFEGLARIGVYLSIDDFGTGYSSLSYLRSLPARQLKIDRSFVSDLETSRDARAIVDAVVHLAHAMGLSVVAEGVETEGQRDILLELGCDELQGYFYARPMPANDLLAWTKGHKPEGGVDFSPSTLMALPQV
jgi:diguanylate cyclase (GGDEF)-like protein